MKNKEIANIFYEIADFLEMQDVEFKPRAYRRAARSIESLSTPIEEFYRDDTLQEISGVGEALANKIAEYLETGKVEAHQELKEELPVDIEALTRVEGLGPKRVQKLYDALGITDLDELEEAAEAGKIAEVSGFGAKTQQNILDHIDLARTGAERTLIGNAFPIAEQYREALESSPHFDRVEVVGSYRRRKPTVGDLDILAVSDDPEAAMDEFTSLPNVKEVLGHGETKSSIVVEDGLHIDLRIVESESYGAALIYFTGSKDHNIEIRNLAIDKGWTLNEYGLFESEDQEKLVAGETEEKVYDALGLGYIEPELRENTGEVAAARDGALPDLIEVGDVRGDLQMHTPYSDGADSVMEMARAAQELGREYILITDHGPALRVTGGLEDSDIEEQFEEVQQANEELDIEVLQGAEANITDDGLDISQQACEKLDLLLAAIHVPVDDPTAAVKRAFREYPVDIWAHPLNRKVARREPIDLKLDEVVECALDEGIALEINAQPERSDLPWDLVKKYRGDAEFTIGTDAHSTGGLELLKYGVFQARRGWLEKDDVLTTLPLEELLEHFGAERRSG